MIISICKGGPRHAVDVLKHESWVQESNSAPMSTYNFNYLILEFAQQFYMAMFFLSRQGTRFFSAAVL